MSEEIRGVNAFETKLGLFRTQEEAEQAIAAHYWHERAHGGFIVGLVSGFIVGFTCVFFI